MPKSRQKMTENDRKRLDNYSIHETAFKLPIPNKMQ
jgi:hypothetical protein